MKHNLITITRLLLILACISVVTCKNHPLESKNKKDNTAQVEEKNDEDNSNNNESKEGNNSSDTDNNNNDNQEDNVTSDNIIEESEIKDYFLNQQDNFGKKKVDFINSQIIKISEINAYKEKIWKIWKESNKLFNEEKLISLSPLTEGKSSSWTLPSNLEANAIMPYYWGSKGTKPSQGYPLFIYLHGSGPKTSEWSAGKYLAEHFEDAPSTYFIPQIPNMGEYYRWWQKAKLFAWEKLFRLAYLSGEIDAKRIYLIGISEGGYGSQRLASYYADYLAGAGPMAGGEPLINAPIENCRNIAFSLRTGGNDTQFHRNQLTRYTKEAFEKAKKEDSEGYTHFIDIIDGSGHAINYYPTSTWLKNFTRTAHPKKIVWEDFDIDGVYRKAFYNIEVKKRSADRTRYIVDIKDNQINISVDKVDYKGTVKSPYWNFFLKYDKTYTRLHDGEFIIYLNEQLVDLTKDVRVTVNGEEYFNDKVKIDMKNIINSCATYFDPERLFPASIQIKLK